MKSSKHKKSALLLGLLALAGLGAWGLLHWYTEHQASVPPPSAAEFSQVARRMGDVPQLSAAGVVRAKDAVRVGKLVRADWFLLGTCYSNSLIVRLVDGHTGVMREVGLVPVDTQPKP